MVYTISEARPLQGYRVWLRFEDGVEGELSLAHLRGVDSAAPVRG